MIRGSLRGNESRRFTLRLKWSIQTVITAVFLASGMIALLEWRALSNLRQENQSLREIATAIQRLREDNETLKQTQAVHEQRIERLRTESSEVLKLRGEVSGLREQAKELERLRAETVRLRAEKSLMAASATKAGEQESIVQQQWEKIEVDDSMAAVYALRAIPLLENGENQKAMDMLAKPVGMYYRVYKTRASTEERSNLLARIEEAAKKHPAIARELERVIK